MVLGTPESQVHVRKDAERSIIRPFRISRIFQAPDEDRGHETKSSVTQCLWNNLTDAVLEKTTGQVRTETDKLFRGGTYTDKHEDAFGNVEAHSTHSGCWPQIMQNGEGYVARRRTWMLGHTILYTSKRERKITLLYSMSFLSCARWKTKR